MAAKCDTGMDASAGTSPRWRDVYKLQLTRASDSNCALALASTCVLHLAESGQAGSSPSVRHCIIQFVESFPLAENACWDFCATTHHPTLITVFARLPCPVSNRRATASMSDGGDAINLDSDNEIDAVGDDSTAVAPANAGAGADAGAGAGGSDAGAGGGDDAGAGEGEAAGDGSGDGADGEGAAGSDAEDAGAAITAQIEELDEALNKMQQEMDQDTILSGDVDAAAAAAAGLNEYGFNDAFSIYVGNVDYNTTPAQLNDLFSQCGTVNQITIPVNRFHKAKGCVYDVTEAGVVPGANPAVSQVRVCRVR